MFFYVYSRFKGALIILQCLHVLELSLIVINIIPSEFTLMGLTTPWSIFKHRMIVPLNCEAYKLGKRIFPSLQDSQSENLSYETTVLFIKLF